MEKEAMITIKGLGKYYFLRDEEGVVPVNRKTGRKLKVISRGSVTGRTYNLRNDVTAH